MVSRGFNYKHKNGPEAFVWCVFIDRIQCSRLGAINSIVIKFLTCLVSDGFQNPVIG